MEVIAVYWEPKIKTYGFQVKTGLRMVTATVPFERVAQWGERLEGGNNPKRDFVLVLAQPVDAGVLRMHMLFEPPGAGQISDWIQETNLEAGGTLFEIDTPAELVYFQGPHFGDRYGIANAAFQALANKGWQLLAAGCSGASVYIVVPENRAQAAVKCLSESFITPGTPIRPSVNR